MAKEDIVAKAKDQFAADQASALDKALGAAYDGGVADQPPVVGADADEQAKIDAAVAQAVAPLNAQIAALQAQSGAAAPVDTTPFSQADIDAAVSKVTDADAADMKALQAKLDLDDADLASVKASFKKQVQSILDSLSDSSATPTPAPAPAPAAPAVDQPAQS